MKNLLQVLVLICFWSLSLNGSWAAQRIDINSAEATTLQQLYGIGEAKAQAIVDYRKEHGNFSSVEDLQSVPGIGAVIVNKNKHRLEVRTKKTKRKDREQDSADGT